MGWTEHPLRTSPGGAVGIGTCSRERGGDPCGEPGARGLETNGFGKSRIVGRSQFVSARIDKQLGRNRQHCRARRVRLPKHHAEPARRTIDLATLVIDCVAVALAALTAPRDRTRSPQVSGVGAPLFLSRGTPQALWPLALGALALPPTSCARRASCRRPRCR